MKTITLLILGALLTGAGVVRADTVKLQDGSTMEGTIQSETEVTRSTAQERAEKNARWDLVELKKYQLNPQSSFPVAYYDKVISNSFLPFLAKYSNTTAAVSVAKAVANW